MSKKIITVFGATGHQGGSVLRALLADGIFHVRAVTRNGNSDKAKSLQQLNDVTIVEADLNKPETLDNALENAYGVFLVTDFAAHIDHSETQQGRNAIDNAIKNKVQHFVFSGLEDIKSVIGKPCSHFDYKAAIEKYGLEHSDKINFTVIRIPCYFENFETFMVRKVAQNEYIVTAPVDNQSIYGFSVDDTGLIVAEIFKNPLEYKSKIINLATENLTVAEYADILSKVLAPKKFRDSQMKLEAYSQLKFPFVEEMTVMYEFIRDGHLIRDINLTKSISNKVLGFEDWVIKNKERLSKLYA